jgi:outer membrane receptor protein involved in Fe transport
MGSFDAYTQAVVVHEGERDSDLDQNANDILGVLPSYTTLDISAGIGKDDWALDLFVSNLTGEDAPLLFTSECTAETCGANQRYGVRIRPTTVGLRFSKDFD